MESLHKIIFSSLTPFKVTKVDCLTNKDLKHVAYWVSALY